MGLEYLSSRLRPTTLLLHMQKVIPIAVRDNSYLLAYTPDQTSQVQQLNVQTQIIKKKYTCNLPNYRALPPKPEKQDEIFM